MSEMFLPRFMIAAPNSGSGKTTVVCALLKTLLDQEYKVAAFKSGPDYIDPMFHSRVIGAKSRNLDLFMLGRETTKHLLAKNARYSGFSHHGIPISVPPQKRGFFPTGQSAF